LTHFLDITTPGHRSVRLAAGLAVAALFTIATSIAPAGAQPRRDDHHRDVRHFDHRDDHGGGYYPAPPVVYGGPVYAPPPVVYGPAVGINLPGVSIGIN
jgi:hypothetical protein